MVKIKEIKVDKLLSRTSIDLAEYVINPYKGCAFACSHCYAKENKQIKKRNEVWGEFVDVKINADEILKKELATIKPRSVLIGSTTDPFQAAEEKFGVTEKILKIFVENDVLVVVLTCSPLIAENKYIEILKKMNVKVYFSILNEGTRKKNSPKTPDLNIRLSAIEKLFKAGIDVVPYLCPLDGNPNDLRNFVQEFICIIENLEKLGIEKLEIENLRSSPENNNLKKTIEKAVEDKNLLGRLKVVFHWNSGKYFEDVKYT